MQAGAEYHSFLILFLFLSYHYSLHVHVYRNMACSSIDSARGVISTYIVYHFMRASAVGISVTLRIEDSRIHFGFSDLLQNLGWDNQVTVVST